MLADTQRLDRLVTRLLELSRLEADSAPPVELDAADVVSEALGVVRRPRARHVAAARGARWRCTGGAPRWSRPCATWSTTRRRTRPRTRPSTCAWQAPAGDVIISVTNHGPAIPPATLERMWDRFFTTRADRGGTGLGLPIVAAAARVHGGRVTCASSTAEGTTFVLTLPRAAPG